MEKVQGRLLLMFLGSVMLLTGLAGSSTALALPQISKDFNVSNNAATWVVTVGLITTTILLVMFGHLGDLLSKNTVFTIGGFVFVVGSLITGLAPNYWIILFGRIIQAIGTAMAMANAMGIVSDNFPSATRAEALAVISMFTSVGTISGPAFGGMLISLASWRWIYLFNVPTGLIILFLGVRLLKISTPDKDKVKQIWREANWTGQNLFTFGIILFFISSSFISSPKWRILGFVLLIVGFVSTVFSFYQDSHTKESWINPKLLKNMDYLISIAILLIVMLVNSVSNILLPFYLQSFQGMSAFVSGLIMMLQSLVMLFITPIAGYFADHWNRYYLTFIGLIILTISQVGYAVYPLQKNYWLILWPIILNGAGMAIFLSPNNALTMETVPQELSGVAGSLNSLARTYGMTVGISFGAMLMFLQIPQIKVITPLSGMPFVHAFGNVFWLNTFLSIIGVALVVYRLWQNKKATS